MTELDGCSMLLTGESRRHPTLDADIPWVVLFAGLNPHDLPAIRRRAREWLELFPHA